MKSKWFKLTSIMTTLMILVGILVGCGNNATSNANANTSNKEGNEVTEKTKIVWWTHQVHDKDYMQEKIDEFMAENPDIEVEYVVQTDNYAQNLELSFQSNQAPDIFSMKSDARYYVTRDMIAPIDDYITDEHRERFGELLKVDSGNYVDGKTYSMPNIGNIFRLVYNKDLMAEAGITEAPKTLSEMVEDARLMTEAGKADGQYGFAINLKTPAGAFSRSIDKIAEASGAQPYNYEEGKYDFSAMKPIILAFKEMYDKGYMFPGVEGLSMDPLRSQFADGKIGSYISAHWEVGVYNSQFPTEVDWSAAPVPIIDGTEGEGKIGATKAGFWQGISSTSEVKDAAWKLLDYMYSEDVLVGYHDKGLGFSVVDSVLAKTAEPTVKGAKEFQYNSDIDKFWDVTPFQFGYGASYGLTAEGKDYAEEFTAVILGAMDIDEAIEDLNTRYNEAYDKAIEKGEIERIIITD
ncbi:ABC transporter substrate-binding protein [Clostridium sp. DL1XJH146]